MNLLKTAIQDPLTPSQNITRQEIRRRLVRFPWTLFTLIFLLSLIGLLTLYSASGGAGYEQPVIRQIFHLALSIALMFSTALFMDERFYLRYAYLIYGAALLMLIFVATMGHIGMGARRWIDFGFFRMQPSELMKVALTLAMARYYCDWSRATHFGLRALILPLFLMLAPVILILKQPDLGTAILVAATGGTVLFVAGLPWKILIGTGVTAIISLPMAWRWGLHDYQRQRILTLFNPEQDALGSGYHIIQSKIAVGSGGLTGKGFLSGSQSHLQFLPEQHTDFIFSVLAEEWGLLGCAVVILLYLSIVFVGIMIAMDTRSRFGMLLATGMIASFSYAVIVNIGMVIGLLPVVGVPLPMMSYGGSAMITTMLGMGLLAHARIHTRQPM